jgi:hypothetical protein
MSEQPPPDQTVDQPVADDPLDAGLAAAFGPDSGPPLPAGRSVIKALAAGLPAVPSVHLRDPDGEALTPVARPGSENMPVGHDSTGRLQRHGEIARGGMGAVLKGRDTDLGRDIAVKVLLETHQGKTELVQRFVEEAQIAGQLQHPGIAPVYELGQFADKQGRRPVRHHVAPVSSPVVGRLGNDGTETGEPPGLAHDLVGRRLPEERCTPKIEALNPGRRYTQHAPP